MFMHIGVAELGAFASAGLRVGIAALFLLPLALVRGANSDLLSPETAAEMRRRRPDMLFADVPDRAHVPFLDEPQALGVIRNWLEQIR